MIAYLLLFVSYINALSLYIEDPYSVSHMDRHINDGISGKTQRPFVIFHGVGDSCSASGMQGLVRDLKTALPGHYGVCVESGAGSTGWTTTMQAQLKTTCDLLKKNSSLSNGFNVVGLSQGNMIARGIIEQCPEVKVHHYVSIAGPHQGTAAFPKCKNGGGWCSFINGLVHNEVYTSWAQNKFGPANYFKDPMRYDEYLKECKWLPFVNNEKKEQNAIYKQQMTKLDSLTLIMFDSDTVIYPKETAWMQFYKIGSKDELVPLKDSDLYKNDTIGLKTLMNNNKVKFVSHPGQHLNIDKALLEKTVIPALRN